MKLPSTAQRREPYSRKRLKKSRPDYSLLDEHVVQPGAGIVVVHLF